MKKPLLALVALMSIALFTAQTTVFQKTQVFPGSSLLAAPFAGWSVVQLTSPGRLFCNKTVDTCTISLLTARNWSTASSDGTAIGSGHRLALGFNDHFDGTQSQRTLASVSDCTSASLDGNGNCTTSINTWILPGAPVEGFGTNANGTDSTDLAYALSSIPGAEYISYTRNTHIGVNENYGAALVEFASSSGSPLVDTYGETSDNTMSLSKTMTALSLTGTSEAIFQVFGSGEVSSVTSPYSANFYGGPLAVHFTEAAAVNISTGAAPTWTLFGTEPFGAASSAIAFKQ
jgi:hypothetical protein